MKIYGIFRGFPGLGRVVSGAGLLETLRKAGHIVKAYSYMQGDTLLDEYGFDRIIEEQPSGVHIMVIGLNPISKEIGNLIEQIKTDDPDLVIIDGEPLIISTLALVFPRNRIISLLNPSDIYNPSLPEASVKFYRQHYLTAKNVFVHGINVQDFSWLARQYDCNIYNVNTILRPEIVGINVKSDSKKIVCILGGGSANASSGFVESTLKIALKVIDLARIMDDYEFIIYCNDKHIKAAIDFHDTKNVVIKDVYCSPAEMYGSAKAVICRAGRNTASELLYLNIPAVLFSTSNDFRAVEQGKNINDVCYLSEGLIGKANISEETMTLRETVLRVIGTYKKENHFEAGNLIVMNKINKIIRNLYGGEK